MKAEFRQRVESSTLLLQAFKHISRCSQYANPEPICHNSEMFIFYINCHNHPCRNSTGRLSGRLVPIHFERERSWLGSIHSEHH